METCKALISILHMDPHHCHLTLPSALQAFSTGTDKQQACLDLLQLHADLPHLFLGFDMVYKSVKGLTGLDSCLASRAPSPESSGVFLSAVPSGHCSSTPSRPSSATPSQPLSMGSAQKGGLDVAAKLAVVSRFRVAFQALSEVACFPCLHGTVCLHDLGAALSR